MIPIGVEESPITGEESTRRAQEAEPRPRCHRHASGSRWVVSPPAAPIPGERYTDDHAQSDRQEGFEQRPEILDAGDRLAPDDALKGAQPVGTTNREIGDLMWISTNTVKFHIRNIYRKLEAERRTQAVENARSLGLIA